MIGLAIGSLWVELEAASRYQLSFAFGTVQACVKVVGHESGSPTLEHPRTNQTVVLTNNGRLPITILNIFDASANAQGDGGDFYWTSLEQVNGLHRNAPIELDTGQAVVVAVISEGRSQMTPLSVLTSDGKLQVLNVIQMPEAVPASIREAQKRLDGCEPSNNR